MRGNIFENKSLGLRIDKTLKRIDFVLHFIFLLLLLLLLLLARTAAVARMPYLLVGIEVFQKLQLSTQRTKQVMSDQ